MLLLRFHNYVFMHMSAFPALFLASHPTIKSQDFDSLRAIINAAASLGPLDAAKLITRANRKIPILQGIHVKLQYASY